MAKIYSSSFIKNTRLYITYGLVFFLLAIAASCKKHSQNITLAWKDGRATGIQIPQSLILDYSELRVKHSVKVVISGTKNSTGIFGSFTPDGDRILFEPLIPLSAGLTYDILQDDKLIGQIQVPINKGETPKLITIYPEQDTVPENLLKLYFHFSKPMQAGQSISHVYLVGSHKDTMRRVFLDLQPELWDTTHTVPTLWLDPGRIKRGLVLNKELGNPLKKLESYQLVVSKEWKDNSGLKLTNDYTKQFVVGERDEQSPDLNKWQITTPKAGTSTPLMINTQKPLDHYLLQESIQILNNGAAIKGTIEVSAKDRAWKFTPAEPWKAQPYQIRVTARLEDLAGNNLNRVFDRDITKDKTQRDQAYYERGFEVK